MILTARLRDSSSRRRKLGMVSSTVNCRVARQVLSRPAHADFNDKTQLLRDTTFDVYTFEYDASYFLYLLEPLNPYEFY